MNAFRRSRVDALHQIQIDFLCHERNHGRRTFADRHKRSIQRHVGIDLILLHALSPEALPAPSHIPVAHLVHELVQHAGRLRDPVMLQIVVHRFDHRVELR